MYDEMKLMYLRNHPLFAQADMQTVADACQLARVKTAGRGEHFHYGDAPFSRIYLLIQGKVKLSEMADTEEELVKDILTAPDLFGDLGLEGKPAPDELAEALATNTIVCYFSIADFRRLLQQNPGITLNYANMVNRKLQKLENRHADLVFRDARSRLIRFIKSWAQTDGNRIGDKIVLNNYLTHSDIAGVIATSRQSVNVFLNELRDSGLLCYNRKRIELNDPMAWN